MQLRLVIFRISLGFVAALTCACAPKFNHTGHQNSNAKSNPEYSVFDTSSQTGGRAVGASFAVTNVESKTSVHVNTASAGAYVVRGGIYGQ